MSDRTDGELMERYAAGDAAAFDELFGRYEQRAFAYFMRRTRFEDRASDLFQELFLRIHRFRGRYDPSRPFAPWFHRIARNVLVDEFRRAARSREVALDMDAVPSPEPDAERQLELQRKECQLLSLIPKEQAAVLVAAKVHGLDYTEIASRVGKSVDAVRQTASRALRRLNTADGCAI